MAFTDYKGAKVFPTEPDPVYLGAVAWQHNAKLLGDLNEELGNGGNGISGTSGYSGLSGYSGQDGSPGANGESFTDNFLPYQILTDTILDFELISITTEDGYEIGSEDENPLGLNTLVSALNILNSDDDMIVSLSPDGSLRAKAYFGDATYLSNIPAGGNENQIQFNQFGRLSGGPSWLDNTLSSENISADNIEVNTNTLNRLSSNLQTTIEFSNSGEIFNWNNLSIGQFTDIDLSSLNRLNLNSFINNYKSLSLIEWLDYDISDVSNVGLNAYKWNVGLKPYSELLNIWIDNNGTDTSIATFDPLGNFVLNGSLTANTVSATAFIGDGSGLTGVAGGGGAAIGSNGDLQFNTDGTFTGGGPNWNGSYLQIAGSSDARMVIERAGAGNAAWCEFDTNGISAAWFFGQPASDTGFAVNYWDGASDHLHLHINTDGNILGPYVAAVAATGTLTIGGSPVDGQTIVVNGHTFTYKDSPSVPGEFNFIIPGFGDYFFSVILNSAGIGVVAVYDNNVTINLTASVAGTAGNVDIVNSVAAFSSVSGMSGGIDAHYRYSVEANTGNIISYGQVCQVPQILSSGATITWDVDIGATAILTLSGTNRTLTIANAFPGGTYVLKIKQGAGGGNTITTWTNFKWPNSTPPTLSIAEDDEDIITAVTYDGTNFYGIYQGAFG